MSNEGMLRPPRAEPLTLYERSATNRTCRDHQYHSNQRRYHTAVCCPVVTLYAIPRVRRVDARSGTGRYHLQIYYDVITMSLTSVCPSVHQWILVGYELGSIGFFSLFYRVIDILSLPMVRRVIDNIHFLYLTL